MDTILDTLQELSDVANQVLPQLEKYDYRKEAEAGLENNLPLDGVLSKPLKEIVDSLLKYCIPIIGHNNNLPKNKILCKDNIQSFVENLNISGDKSTIHQIQFIKLSPVKSVADYLEEIGLSRQARQLINAYEFGQSLRQFKCAAETRDNIQIHPIFILPKDELNEEELQQAQNYADFCSIFKKESLLTSQKRALYDRFRRILNDKEYEKPHLVIIAAILLLMKKSVFGRPLVGTLNHIRSVVFKSIGLPETTAKAYKSTSLNKGETPSVFKYKSTADKLLSISLGNTR